MNLPISLVIGLGNPGVRYAATRHNAGFFLIDGLAKKAGVQFFPEKKFQGYSCRLSQNGCRLFKPDTFMNHSGQAAGNLVRFYQIPLEQVLVAHDELDLPPGAARLKRGGGHGGHNGLRSLIQHFGGGAFSRLRLGIGHPGEKTQVADYVLRPPVYEESIALENAIEAALQVMPLILEGEWARAMNQLHLTGKSK